MLNREDLIDAYAIRIVDGMDMDTLVVYAIEKLREDLETWSEDVLREDVAEYAPDLLEEA